MKKAFALTFIASLLLSAVAGTMFVNTVTANYYPPNNINILINSPANETYNVNSILLNLTLLASRDVHPTAKRNPWIYYILDEKMNVTYNLNEKANVMTTLNGISHGVAEGNNELFTCEANLTELSEGVHKLEIYTVEDFWFIISSHSVVYFSIDTTAPKISNLSLENKTYYTTDLPITFTVDETGRWIAYSLDNQTSVAITGNTTLNKLSYGAHNLIIYSADVFGNTGSSETIHFIIAKPFLTTFIIAAVVIVAIIVGAGLILYFRKRKRQVEHK